MFAEVNSYQFHYFGGCSAYEIKSMSMLLVVYNVFVGRGAAWLNQDKLG